MPELNGQPCTPRGFERWKRAAVNAHRNPHSVAAALYRSRYDIALQVSTGARAVKADKPYEFIGPEYDHSLGKKVFRRSYATCSVFCTVMQIQLAFSVNSLEAVANVFKGNNRLNEYGYTLQPLDTGTLKRSITCHGCGKKIKAKR